MIEEAVMARYEEFRAEARREGEAYERRQEGARALLESSRGQVGDAPLRVPVRGEGRS